jgi:predicted Fe-Mo cluster-binding NifX family protein
MTGGHPNHVDVLAIPVFRSRVAPVFDSCHRAVVIPVDNTSERERSKLGLQNLSLTQRVSVLKGAGVTTLICGGISDTLHAMLESSGVCVMAGIAGEIEEVVSAFLSHGLNDPRFSMPGRGGPIAGRQEEAARLPSDENKGAFAD